MVAAIADVVSGDVRVTLTTLAAGLAERIDTEVDDDIRLRTTLVLLRALRDLEQLDRNRGTRVNAPANPLDTFLAENTSQR